jgi:hypothetical protein
MSITTRKKLQKPCKFCGKNVVFETEQRMMKMEIVFGFYFHVVCYLLHYDKKLS